MKTEKRKAKVGERILITNKYPGEERYENGDVLNVLGLEGNGGDVYVFSQDSGLVNYEEYEVLIDENETEADSVENVNFSEMSLAELEEFVQKAVKALSKRAFHAGFRDGREAQRKLDGKRDERRVSPQQRRDEIIEKAKREVEEIRNDPIQMEGLLAAFVVDREKRTVTALLSSVLTGVVERQGVAKCRPDDCFNVHIGKIIALYRALGLEVPDEYLNAPQPTEVRIGDIVYIDGFTMKKRIVNEDGGRGFIYRELAEALINDCEGRIIDDSRKGVTE